ncbi:MLO-like protein 9 [Coffea arabica]|uniref:MLO-like protein n=1 Tax=Coffea arabica TaxID=13443 RepID=A0ABM4VVE3_COFAR
MAGDRAGRTLEKTPTWAVALVSAVIVVVSILLEKALHGIGKTFQRKRKEALNEALEKIKAELMVLGFISLILTFGQNYISKICIPLKVAETMLPCSHKDPEVEGEHHRRLLWNEHRFLAADSPATACKSEYVPVISVNGLHQLHIFIFFLAVFHVIFGAMTMTLGRLQTRGWKEWEREAVRETEASNDTSRFRLTHETSFVRDNTGSMARNPILFYPVCFYRQFFRSVRKADYMTMRHGFISVHLAPGSKFDFQKYIRRSLEDDFKIVVGISPTLWASAVIYLLLNVGGSQIMIWLSLMPLVTILAVGTKLQAIITQMAVEIQERHAVVQGIPLVQVSDRHFWFSRPHLILHLIHFTLFQNAFEITFLIWTTYEFGIHSCFYEGLELSILRVVMGVAVQVLCSYITLPLYALVTQMGSHIKKSIFDEQTKKALTKWTLNAKKKNNVKPGTPQKQRLGGSPVESPENSPKLAAGPSSTSGLEMSGLELRKPHGQHSSAANITASVDIPDPPHTPPPNDVGDLLSAP